MSIPREGSRDIKDGIIVSRYPDWCNAPEKPIPFQIYAKQHEDANTAPTVRQTGKRSHTAASIITCCHGDEAGIGGGVKSGTKESVCQPKTWSKTVRFEGNYVVRDSDEWWMNNKNTTGKLAYVEDVKDYEPTPPFLQTGATESNNPADASPESPVEVDPRAPTGLPEDNLTISDVDTGPAYEMNALYAAAVNIANQPQPNQPSGPMNDNNRPGKLLTPNPDSWKKPPPKQPTPAPTGKRYWLAPHAMVFGLGVEAGSRVADSFKPNTAVELEKLITGQRKQMNFDQGWAVGQYKVPWFYSSDLKNEWIFNRLLSIKTGQMTDFRILPDEELEEIIEMPWPQPAQIKKNIEKLEEGQLAGTDQAVPDPAKKLAPYPVITENNNRTTSKCKSLVICFQPNAVKKNPDDMNAGDIKLANEFDRQLALQNNHLNRLTPVDAYNNMLTYLANPEAMRALSKPLQARTRNDYERKLKRKYKDVMNRDELIAQEMSTIVALHNPDMRAGGHVTSVADPSIPLEDRIGDLSVNSSIGGQWRYRAGRLQQHLLHQIKNRCPTIQAQLLICPSQIGRGNAGKPLNEN